MRRKGWQTGKARCRQRSEDPNGLSEDVSEASKGIVTAATYAIEARSLSNC